MDKLHESFSPNKLKSKTELSQNGDISYVRRKIRMKFW